MAFFKYVCSIDPRLDSCVVHIVISIVKIPIFRPLLPIKKALENLELENSICSITPLKSNITTVRYYG